MYEKEIINFISLAKEVFFYTFSAKEKWDQKII